LFFLFLSVDPGTGEHSMRLTRLASLTTLAVLLFVPVIGCGPGKSDVTGTVTLDGKNLSDGTIVFTPAKGVAVSAEIKDGKYTALKVPHGEATVAVSNDAIRALVEQTKKFSSAPRGGTGGPVPAGVSMPPEAKAALEKQLREQAEIAQRNKALIANYRPIPDKYKDPKSSGLKATVGAGTTTFDFPLTSQ
jgi:hypothetical protein